MIIPNNNNTKHNIKTYTCDYKNNSIIYLFSMKYIQK